MFWAPRAGGRFGGAIASRMVPQHACAVAGCALVGSRRPRSFAQRAWLRDETVSSSYCYSDSNWLVDLAGLGSCAENQQVVPRFYRDLDLAFGAHTNRMGRLGN